MSLLRRTLWVPLLLGAFVLTVTAPVQAQSDHHLRWHSIQTAHFRVHYHEPLGVLARELAQGAEAVHERVSGALMLSLSQRVEVVISDESDAANGLATALPYNTIRLRAAAPDDMSPLADYDDWATMLLTHEHTHVLHFEQAAGLPRLLQYVFGRFYSPHGYLPGWFIEGLAVVEETAHTTGGRGRSTMFDMYLRMDALEGRMFGLDLMSFEGDPWPHGNTRYLYGQALVGFIARRHGQAALGRFITEYGTRLVPYGLNRAMKRATGETFTAMHRAFVDERRAQAREVAERIEAEGRVEGRRITWHGELTRSPRYLSRDEVVYAVADGRHVPALRRLRLSDPRGSAERVTRVSSVGQVAVVPKTRRLLYSASAPHRGVYDYQDLSSVDADGKADRRETHGVRAREPDVSPDGHRVAFVTQGAGTSHLEIAAREDIARTRRVVVQSARHDQVYTPRWSPDGTKIAYGAFQRGGFRDIWILDLKTGVRTRVTYDRAIDRGPVFSRDGRTLYFSSDRSGIANLYAFDLARGWLTQLTNVVGGAFQPDVSPDGDRLVYVGYTARGFDLFELALAPITRHLARAEVLAREAPEALPEPAPLVSTPYQPLSTLWPRYWELSTDDPGSGRRLTVSTSGADVVGFHSWSFRATTQLERRDLLVEGGYSYRRPRFPVVTYASYRDRERYDLAALGAPRRWRARESVVGAGSSFAFPAPLYVVRLRLDYYARLLQKGEALEVPLDPNYPPPVLPPLGTGTELLWGVTFDRVQRQAFDISRSWGQTLNVSGTVREPYLGGRARSYSVSYRLEQYLRFDFQESVLALAFTGAHHTWVDLGGFAAQWVPLRDALLGTQGAPADYARLRGFPTRYGDTMQVLQLEYRALLGRINRGYETLPIFARRVHAALFMDAGNAYSGRLDLAQVSVGVGGELRLDWSAHYGNDYTLRVGIARGVTEGGVLQWYTTLATPF